jgi:hypothetical protein
LADSAPGTRLGIGVASGADRVFVLPAFSPDIEDVVQLPLALARDVRSGHVQWSGHVLVNPFTTDDTGSLIDLRDFPKLKAYFEANGTQLRRRHVSKSKPDAWYRTIDRVWHRLATAPKLLIPDIQAGNVVAVESGKLYPHHNLYWITSEGWPLFALRALLTSSHVLQQIRAFSVQMRGGSLRYQAQTLRRVRLPHVSSIPARLLTALEAVGATGAAPEIDEITDEVFRLAMSPRRRGRERRPA